MGDQFRLIWRLSSCVFSYFLMRCDVVFDKPRWSFLLYCYSNTKINDVIYYPFRLWFVVSLENIYCISFVKVATTSFHIKLTKTSRKSSEHSKIKESFRDLKFRDSKLYSRHDFSFQQLSQHATLQLISSFLHLMITQALCTDETMKSHYSAWND